VTFWTEFDPDTWLENGSNGTFLGFSTEAQKDIDFEEELGGEHQFLGYELETSVKKNNEEEALLEGEGLELEYTDDGFFYDVEIRETVDLNLGKAARKEVEDGLLSVHFTGYRDSDGNDYIVHSDPKKWVEDGKEKYPDLGGLPDIESGLQKTEDFFSDEKNYTLDEGLGQVENYLSDIAEDEQRPLSDRWLCLRDAVSGFRESLQAGKPVNISRRKQSYAT
jgi:hypothetical protein